MGSSFVDRRGVVEGRRSGNCLENNENGAERAYVRVVLAIQMVACIGKRDRASWTVEPTGREIYVNIRRTGSSTERLHDRYLQGT